ncbi:MAG: hypothetical protein CK423_05580 [Legionella sp.]|nr:MAG: hypothetical protein CK423_05580 [Legionella sp.]
MKSKDELLQKLQEIQQNFSYQDSLADDAVTKDLLIRLSGYQRMMDNLHRGGSAVVKTGDASATLSHARPAVVEDLHAAGLGLAVFDFLQIPSLYLYAYLLGYKLPFTWGNGAQWSRSALLLGLSLTCLLFPPAAPIIAFVMAGIALVSSAFFLVQVVSELKILAKKKTELDEALVIAEKDLGNIQQQASELMQQLANKCTQDLDLMADEVAKLDAAWVSQTALLQDLQRQLSENRQATEKLSGEEIRGRCARVFFASLTVIGLVTAVFFPPVGMAFLAGTALFGVAYFLVPSLYHLGKWMGKKTESTLNPAEKLSDEEQPLIELSSDYKIQKALTKQSILSERSTTAVNHPQNTPEAIPAQGRFLSHPVVDKEPESEDVKSLSP